MSATAAATTSANDRISIHLGEDGVADVRFVRAEKMNALDPEMFERIIEAGHALQRMKGLRAVVLSGEGRAFCAGLDLSNFARKPAEDEPSLTERTYGNSNRAQQVAMQWRKLPVPVIAAVHGVCLGGGLQIASGADIRIVHPETRMAIMEMKWGLVPDMGGYVLWRGLVRDDVLRELIYTNREFTGAEAVDLGLATHVDPNPRERALALQGARDRPHPSGFAAELCTLREAPPAGDAWLHEIKWDGYRLLADLVDGQAKLRSRNDLDWTARVPAIARAVEALPVSDAHLDGELVVLDDQGHSDFSALQRVLEGSSRQPLRYVVFDLPGVAGVDLSRTPLIERKRLLRELLGSTPGVLAYSDHVVGHGAEVFAASGKAGFEGIISKRVDARYRGGRGQDWIKVKHEDGDEFVVVGYTAPRGARGHFGSLLLARPGLDGLSYVGRVGSGFGDAMLRDLFKRMRPLETAGPTVELPAHIPLRPRNVQWLQPRLVVEVAFRGWAKEGLLRQASFRGLREDKDMADLQPEKPAVSKAKAPARAKAGKSAAAAKTGKATAAAKTAATRTRAKAARKAGSADCADVVITHPDRVVYPADGMTKGDVAAYYRAIAPWLLRDIAGRPLSLVRCPDGATGQCFFQKHHGAGLGEAVHALPLRQKSGIEDYVWIDDATGLLQLVQMNVLEFHPWGATVEDPERADRLVFDLDPGEGVSWKAVCDGAREVRGRLREAGLESFLRMSGGKGLHVVVPLAPAVPWEQARDFCEAFARAMEAHAPERWLANARKAKRTGRIFLDWLRNTRGATSVASWSLRAREHATVAMPLRWEELGKFDRPGAFNPDKALQRASRLRKDPWDGIDRLRQSLPG